MGLHNRSALYDYRRAINLNIGQIDKWVGDFVNRSTVLKESVSRAMPGRRPAFAKD
jgi:hypothetical protein